MIRSADSEKRQALAQTIDAFHEDYPEEFNWVTGGQAPALDACNRFGLSGLARN